jgi:ATP-dependent RNA helicase DDX56/DBP9
VKTQSLIVSSLESLVIDEADLILSYGHDEDVRQIFSGTYLPQVFQSFLMSATMTEDVELLKGLALRNPVGHGSLQSVEMCSNLSQAILKLEEDEDEAAHLSQYAVRCG